MKQIDITNDEARELFEDLQADWQIEEEKSFFCDA